MSAYVKVVSVALIIVAVAMTVVVAAPVTSQAPRNDAVDFTKATLAEVRNAQGQVVLSGRFVVNEEDDDDIERKAPLSATSVDPDAAGEAEVELSVDTKNRRQEVEFSVRNLRPGAVYTFVIDSKVFATATADDTGRAAEEREVPLPAASGSR